MRILVIVVICISLFTACRKKRQADTSAACVSGTGATSGWVKEDLNASYTIEFPAWYVGAGYIKYKGDYFEKTTYTTTDTINIFAQYGDKAVSTTVWSSALSNSSAETIELQYINKVYALKNKKRLCGGDGTIGYYYYTLTKEDTSNKNTGLGVLYLRSNTADPTADFLQNIILDFPASKEKEMIDIISSIKIK